MKASLYIKELKKLIDEYGDLEMSMQDYDPKMKLWNTFPCKPDFWHRAYGKENTGDCFGSVPEEE